MSRIDELNDGARRALDKIDRHLDAQATSMTATSNVAITLGTALAAGLAIVVKDVVPQHPSPYIIAGLAISALALGLSLLNGVLVYFSRSSISKTAVEMWDTSKQLTLGALAEGGGDEQRTEAAFMNNMSTVATSLSTAASAHQAEYVKMSDRLGRQVAFLAGSVLLTLVVVFFAYWSTDIHTDVRVRAEGSVPIAVSGSVSSRIDRPVSVVSTPVPAALATRPVP